MRSQTFVKKKKRRTCLTNGWRKMSKDMICKESMRDASSSFLPKNEWILSDALKVTLESLFANKHKRITFSRRQKSLWKLLKSTLKKTSQNVYAFAKRLGENRRCIFNGNKCANIGKLTQNSIVISCVRTRVVFWQNSTEIESQISTNFTAKRDPFLSRKVWCSTCQGRVLLF